MQAEQPDQSLPCAEYSEAVDEPLLGTAPHVGLWLLLEARASWSPKPEKANEFPDVVNRWVQDATTRGAQKGLKPRVQYLRHRRHARDPIMVGTCLDGVLRMQQINDYSELAGIDPLANEMPISEENLYLVCTHASRDVCCSRRGLPTWQQLDRLSQGRAWQTTHLGGHRFAANVLALPSERLYGRISSLEAESFFQKIENGEVPVRYLRGKASLPPEVQVCEQAYIAQDATFLDIQDDKVLFKTACGVASSPRPNVGQVMTKKSCGDEVQVVEVLLPT